MKKRGRLICVEGGDWTGKTTFVQELSEQLMIDESLDVVTTREVGGSPIGDELRKLILDPDMACDPRTLELMIQACRAEHWQTTIPELVTQYDVVISDRGIASGLAYGMANGHLPEDLVKLVEFALGIDGVSGVYDGMILLTGDPTHLKKLCAENRSDTGKNRIEKWPIEKHVRIKNILEGCVSRMVRPPSNPLTEEPVLIMAAMEDSPETMAAKAATKVRRWIDG